MYRWIHWKKARKISMMDKVLATIWSLHSTTSWLYWVNDLRKLTGKYIADCRDVLNKYLWQFIQLFTVSWICKKCVWVGYQRCCWLSIRLKDSEFACYCKISVELKMRLFLLVLWLAVKLGFSSLSLSQRDKAGCGNTQNHQQRRNSKQPC
jgi:hypothetical protein